MTSDIEITTPDTEQFLAAATELSVSFGWKLHSFQRDEEVIGLVALNKDPSFEEILWVYDPIRAFLRCLLVSRAVVPEEREAAVIELCARINSGLLSGCLEFSFNDRALIFRDSAELRYGPVVSVLSSTSARLLSLGSRYASAIRDTLAGSSPAEAVEASELT